MSDQPFGSRRVRVIFSVAALIILVGCVTGSALPPAGSPAAPASQSAAVPSVEPSPTATSLPTATPFPVADSLSKASFTLPLTTQRITDTSAVFYFELSAPQDGLLLYRSMHEGASEQSVAFDSSKAAHQIAVQNLNPGETYQASVIVKDADSQYHRPGFLDKDWGSVSFTTWADHQPMRFGIIGDSGFGDPVTPQLADQMAAAKLDFAVQVGDIVYNIFDNKDAFEAFALKYYQPFSPVLHQMPFYLVVGNHDVENAAVWNGVPFYDHAFPLFPDDRFPAAPGGTNDWFAFAYGNVQFLMLNTEAMNNPKERQEQKAWLAERLADKRFAVSIPAFHVAPFTGGAHVNDGAAVKADWVPLFEQYGVKLVLSGHDHNYQRLIENGITYVVSGGGSATLYEKTKDIPGSQVFNKVSHFVVFDVYPDRIDLKAIALGGDVIDQVSIPLK